MDSFLRAYLGCDVPCTPATYQMLVSGRTKDHASTVISGNVWDDGSLPPPPVNTGALE